MNVVMSKLPSLAELLLLLLLLLFVGVEADEEDLTAAGLDVDLLGVTSFLALATEACSSSKSGLFKYSSKVLTSESGAYFFHFSIVSMMLL